MVDAWVHLLVPIAMGNALLLDRVPSRLFIPVSAMSSNYIPVFPRDPYPTWMDVSRDQVSWAIHQDLRHSARLSAGTISTLPIITAVWSGGGYDAAPLTSAYTINELTAPGDPYSIPSLTPIPPSNISMLGHQYTVPSVPTNPFDVPPTVQRAHGRPLACHSTERAAALQAPTTVLRHTIGTQATMAHADARRVRPRRYLCDICSYVFTSSTNRARHVRAHYGIKPFGCSPCGISFITNTDLTRHHKSKSCPCPSRLE
ncbi:hypothetical protein AB1N83_007204 [Pleurotus pulmonarius]